MFLRAILLPSLIVGVFERFRGILHEGEIDKRVQFLIEGLFAIRKAKFQVLSTFCNVLLLIFISGTHHAFLLV